MSTRKTPNSQKQIIQSNDGDYNGNLWSTFNIDLDSNPGTIKTSKKLTQVIDSNLIGTNIVQALEIHDGFYYLTDNSTTYDCDVSDDPTNLANWSVNSTIDGTSGKDYGLETDMASFAGALLTSTGTDITRFIRNSSFDPNWWTTVAGGTALTANKVHTLDVLRSGTDTLFITDGNKIRYYNGVAAGTVITIDSLLTANCFTPSLDRMWVGSYTEVGNHASVFEVQVGATNTLGDPAYNQSYDVEGRVCLTMFTYKNTPFVITERGYIQAFNGAGFETVAQFPWANESKVMEGCRPGQVQDPATAKAIHPKGAKVKGKYCYIYVDTNDEYFADGFKLNSRSPSGVWVLNLETYSLTHRYALNDSVSTYGQQIVDRSGAILITNTPETRVMVGAEVNGNTGVWMESDETNQGYFVTTRHETELVADAFESFTVKMDTLDTSETIVNKYKDVSIPNFPLTITDITWLNSTQFVTTDTLTDVEAGDEIEIIFGSYAGELCHVVSITGSTTKTVTVDKAIGTLNDTSDIQIDRYKLIASDTDTGGEYLKYGATENTSPSRQYKVVMKGDITIREVISKSNSKEEL